MRHRGEQAESDRAEAPTGNVRVRRVLGGLLGISLFLAPLVVAGWISTHRARAETALRAADAHMSRQELEAASEALRALPAPWTLSAELRRRGAELFFRLGEDGKGNALLGGQPYRASDPLDQRLRALNERAQRAAGELRAADASRIPDERLAHLRKAVEELPESPALLARLVLEEVLALPASRDRSLSVRFGADYAALRQKAPRRAEELKARLREALDRPRSR